MTNENSSAHRRAWDLIPWIVNGSAPESERRVVQEHLEACADCRQELEFQRQLQAALTLQGPSEIDPHDSWQRLRSRIDTAARPPGPQRPVLAEPASARDAGRAWRS